MEKGLRNLKIASRSLVSYEQLSDGDLEYQEPQRSLANLSDNQSGEEIAFVSPPVDVMSSMATNVQSEIGLSLKQRVTLPKTIEAFGSTFENPSTLVPPGLSDDKDGGNESVSDNIKSKASETVQVSKQQANDPIKRPLLELENPVDQNVLQASDLSEQNEVSERKMPEYEVVKDTGVVRTEGRYQTDFEKLIAALDDPQMTLNSEVFRGISKMLLFFSIALVLMRYEPDTNNGFSQSDHRRSEMALTVMYSFGIPILVILAFQVVLIFSTLQTNKLETEPETLNEFRVLFGEEYTFTNSLKEGIEHWTGEAWNWWPFPPSFQPLRPNEIRVEWKCVGGE